MADFIILAIIATAVILILVRHRKRKQAGMGSCGCGCNGCSAAGQCNHKDSHINK